MTHVNSPRQRPKRKRPFTSQLGLQSMMLPAIAFFLVFSYLPNLSLINGFLHYSLTDGFFGRGWAGWTYVSELLSDDGFWVSLGNSFFMSLVKFPFTFVAPIALALILNELSSRRLKKIAQTASYLPHFLSYVIVATIWIIFLDPAGLVNNGLRALGIIQNPIEFLAEPAWFWWVAMIIDCWQETGWNAIIYLAAIAGINPELYEAATMDGAGRIKKMLRITLPSLLGAAATLFVLNMGNFLVGGAVGSNFNQSFLLGNPFNHAASYVVQHYILRVGLNQLRFSFASVATLLISLFSIVFLYLANFATRKMSNRSIL